MSESTLLRERNWRSVRLKYLAQIVAGQSPPSDTYASDPSAGLPFLQGCAEFGPRSPKPKEYCSEPSKTAPENSILMSVRAPVGELNVADRCYGIGRGLCAIIPREIPQNFLCWALHFHREKLKPLSTGSTYDAVSAEDIGNLAISFLHLENLREIADFLDRETARLDALVAEKERWLDLLAEKRRALITRAVTRGLRDQSIPLLRLKWLLDGIDTGFTPDSYNYPAQEGQHGVLKSGCVNGGVFDPNENKLLADDVDPPANLEVKVCDILMSRASGSSELIGSVAQVREQPAAKLYLSDKTFRLRVKKAICDAEFLVLGMGSTFLRGQLSQIISGAEGLAKNLPQNDIRELLMPFPPLPEQRSIVAHISAETAKLDALRTATERTIELLKERRGALIAAAVTGKIAVPTRGFLGRNGAAHEN